ncbi:RraA family protein [Streptomyces sp. CA-135486]|uniref:RraA family protein n=1 Tax=Streptomyces sp. CA-135486 TaxID=3240049 RepID=UPI003D8E047E
MTATIDTRHSTATLYEASGLDCACAARLRPAWPGARLAGPAYTVRGLGGDNLALHRAVAAAPPGHVLVADLQRAIHGHWGEVLAFAARTRGLLGLVIDGGVRDTTELAGLDFPVFASSISVTGTRKNHPGVLGEPIVLAGVPVATGDLVVADADGVVCLPRAAALSIITRADERVRDEHRILHELREGQTTLDLYNLCPSGETSSPTGDRGE